MSASPNPLTSKRGMMDYKIVRMCRVCGSKRFRKYLDLGRQPLANALLDSPKSKSKKYPLQVLFCEDCALSQLSIVVDPKVLYTNYPYYSSVSLTFRDHCQAMATHIKKILNPEKPLSLIDIASNDGCLLNMFRREGYGLMWGVEPCKALADKAYSKGFAIFNDFWGGKLCWKVPKVKLITALNVLAHVHDIDSFLRTVTDHLLPDGIFVVEVPHLQNLIEQNQFDTVYHEHLSYFLTRPLKRAFKNAGLNVFKIEEYKIHGGSIRIYASMDKREVHPSVWRMESIEERKGLYKLKTYQSYAKKVKNIKAHMKILLFELKQTGKKVMAYGASAKGNTLMNYCRITNIDISSIVDDTPAKQGKFTPGNRIPIVNADQFSTTHPDYIMLTAWNFTAELKEKTKDVGAKYIIPIPQVRIE